MHLKSLFEAAANAKPLVILHSPIIVDGTVMLEAGDTEIDMSAGFVRKVAREITDTVDSEKKFRTQGTTPY